MAWHRHTGDGPLRPEVLHHREYHSEATPLKVGDTLYTCTPHRWAVASEATTGRLIGKYLHQVQVRGNPYLVCHGVAFASVAADECPQRVFLPTFDATVVALDTHTGAPCTGFSDNGVIDLRRYAGRSVSGRLSDLALAASGRQRETDHRQPHHRQRGDR